jgi:hypothetical protein
MSTLSSLRWKIQLPPLHVVLNIQKVLEADAPWLSRRSLKHKPSKLGVKDRRRVVVTPLEVSMRLSGVVWQPLLSIAGLHIWHTSTLLQEFLVGS